MPAHNNSGREKPGHYGSIQQPHKNIVKRSIAPIHTRANRLLGSELRCASVVARFEPFGVAFITEFLEQGFNVLLQLGTAVSRTPQVV